MLELVGEEGTSSECSFFDKYLVQVSEFFISECMKGKILLGLLVVALWLVKLCRLILKIIHNLLIVIFIVLFFFNFIFSLTIGIFFSNFICYICLIESFYVKASFVVKIIYWCLFSKSVGDHVSDLSSLDILKEPFFSRKLLRFIGILSSFRSVVWSLSDSHDWHR